jgi:hypothetical protein
MVENRRVVEQAHEIQALAKELEQFPCVLRDKFMAGGIIAKLPPFWTDFASTLKHKRQELSVAKLIGSLDVKRARAKDTRGKGVETSSANMVQNKNSRASHKKKNKQQNAMKPKQAASFKRKNNGASCFVCGSTDHWASACPDRKFKQNKKPAQEKKTTNMVVSETAEGTSRYGNLLPTILSVCQSPEWWDDTGANIHVCADTSLFSSYQRKGARALLTGNRSHARILGVGTVIPKFTSVKTVLLKNVQHVHSIKKNLVSGSLLCRDGYKLVFESNKCILSNYGTFVGNGYDSGGLFRLSLHDVCNKSVNNVISIESYIWHSRLCHINFGCVSRLSNLNLIPKFDLVKDSKC